MTIHNRKRRFPYTRVIRDPRYDVALLRAHRRRRKAPERDDSALECVLPAKAPGIGMRLMLRRHCVVVTHKQDHVYQARTAIEFQNLDDNLPVNIPQLGSSAPAQTSDDSYIQTQVAIMQSRSFVARVANQLGMDRGVNPKESVGMSARLGQILGFPPKPPLPFEERVIQGALSSLSIRPNRQTRIVELFYDSSDPKLAASFLNTLVAEYSEQSLENRWKSGERTSDWLTAKLSELRTKLEDLPIAFNATRQIIISFSTAATITAYPTKDCGNAGGIVARPG